MTFAQFVKAHYDEVEHLPNKERLKALSVIYKQHKGGSSSSPKSRSKKHVSGGDITHFTNFNDFAKAYTIPKGGALRKVRNATLVQKEVLHQVPSSVPQNLYHAGTSVPSALPYPQHMY